MTRNACRLLFVFSFLLLTAFSTQSSSLQQQDESQAPGGYFRFPAIHDDEIIFTAEGDLWQVSIQGGVAHRLTTHPAEESGAAISPDGKRIAFSAAYEGSPEIYSMPISGGPPKRHTYDGGRAAVVGWTPDGQILYSTRRYSTLPDLQLVSVDPATNARTLVPLAQASDGCYDPLGKTLYFTRLPYQGSHTRRYQGGTVQNIWKYVSGTPEAIPLTSDCPTTSKTPMLWKKRVYFASDRDGTMNIWSMDENGRDVRQHTRHDDFEVKSPSLSNGRIVYQHGADIWLLDLGNGKYNQVPIRLASDFDNMREKWVKKPLDYTTSASLSPDADRIAFTARGQIFVAPAEQGRLVEVTRKQGVRYRAARFMPDGKNILALSDQSGEIEIWTLPANGVGAAQQLTNDGKVLRWEALPSPNGKYIAHHDKDQQLWIFDVDAKSQKLIATSADGGFGGLAWSSDSRWLAFQQDAANTFTQIKIYSLDTQAITDVTSDRYDSYSPAWSPDGDWIYFLSDRNFESLVPSPWGPRQPEPFFDRQTRLYQIALRKGLRSPFQPKDELTPADKKAEEKKDEKKDEKKAEPEKKDNGKAAEVPPIKIEVEGIAQRLIELPVPGGNYSTLATDGKRLYWISRETGVEGKRSLMTLEITNKTPKPETVMVEIRNYQLSQDRKKLAVQKGEDFYIFDAGAKAPAELAKSKVDLSAWTFSLDPQEEWQQMYNEAWRLERDYFYDRGMHGLDWTKIREKYRPLATRVTDRGELSDVLAQMVSELSALHIFVYGGDERRGTDNIGNASLGCRMERDQAAGGYRVSHIYRSDPDRPEALSPLARLGVDVKEGDVILAINGVETLSVPDSDSLLRNQAGKQVLLRVKPQSGEARDLIVTPITLQQESNLRYDEWEFTRRQKVDELSNKRIGYVHLRAMGSGNMAEWAREFYPVFNREALIIDVRHNRGGNIDSWVLEKLLRKAWFFWQPRVGNPTWNMQYAFRGPMITICNEFTASDGEAFSEGFRRLGLGKLLGSRTWGGEIWLSSSNVLVDYGIATAAEMGVFGPEGQWLIEGHGVDPDISVDNLPKATFDGGDAQLDAAVKHLLDELKRNPVPMPKAPPYPKNPNPAPGRKPIS